jgi:hypothetical protein
MTWVGVSIALFGAFGYALGAALQQFEAVSAGATLRLVRRPRWWIGGVIGFTGACLHALALSFAPLIAVQPISVATLVFAVPLAAMMYGRRPHRSEILGSVAVAAGLLGIMLLVPAHNVMPELSDRAAVGFLCVVGIVVAVSQLVARRVKGAVKALVLSIGAGSVTGSVSTFVRVVGGGFERVGLMHWFTLAIPVLLLCAVVLLQQTYAVGHFGIAYAGVQVVDPVTSVLAGVFLLGEPLPSGVGAIVPATLAAGVLVAGTITLGRHAPDHSRQARQPISSPAPATIP